MPLIRIVLLLTVLGGLTLFALSNASPTLSLIFLGMKTPPLPLATWIGIAIATGAVTSFFLQLLSYLQRGNSPRRIEQLGDVPPQTRYARRESPRTQTPEPQTRYTSPPPPPETPRSGVASDWEESSSENWDFEEEPAATSSPKDFNREPPRSASQTERTSFETKQEPKTGSQAGSVYSYSYRDQDIKESGVGKPDTVYDANYRVIAPPYQKPPEPEENDDDWGFEDDEDFDEGNSRPKRR
jgi:hypothetical protein